MKRNYANSHTNGNNLTSSEKYNKNKLVVFNRYREITKKFLNIKTICFKTLYAFEIIPQ